ncbi:hypothetical protein Y032_0767g2183 [Ancylostoma ceylanicum]|nr:hypothetical protein Y032_0767g2183 [Ancylostoma ceylanicum]
MRKQKSHSDGTELDDQSLKLKHERSSKMPAAVVEKKESSSTRGNSKMGSDDASSSNFTRQSNKSHKSDSSH